MPRDPPSMSPSVPQKDTARTHSLFTLPLARQALKQALIIGTIAVIANRPRDLRMQAPDCEYLYAFCLWQTVTGWKGLATAAPCVGLA